MKNENQVQGLESRIRVQDLSPAACVGFIADNDNSSSLLGRQIENKNAKYTATTTLSAARAAATSSGDV